MTFLGHRKKLLELVRYLSLVFSKVKIINKKVILLRR